MHAIQTSGVITQEILILDLNGVFVGYNPSYMGYKCLDKTIGRIYLSRDVVFDETKFPFITENTVESLPSYFETIVLTPVTLSPSVENEPVKVDGHERCHTPDIIATKLACM